MGPTECFFGLAGSKLCFGARGFTLLSRAKGLARSRASCLSELPCQSHIVFSILRKEG